MDRNDIIGRYRQLREISVRRHNEALSFLSRDTILQNAHRLGLLWRNRVIAESDEEMTLIFDLALYSARKGRSRALDRYARASQFPPQSDEARMLDAMRDARFSIWRIERVHGTAGVIVSDLVRGSESWLIDEGLEASCADGFVFAARLAQPEEFAMSCGVVVPVDPLLMTEVGLANCWAGTTAAELAESPRFATAIYRAAVANGVMSFVTLASTEEREAAGVQLSHRPDPADHLAAAGG